MDNGHKLLGAGIYTVPEAARITGVSAPRIRRSLSGSSSRSGAAAQESPRIWGPDLPVLDQSLALSFRDLIELRFIDHFLRLGVAWATLRRAAGHAAEIVGSSHPFSTRLFRTDGYRIFMDFAEKTGERALLDVIERQYTISAVVEPRLYEGLQFEHERVARWFPLRGSKRVVIDPAIAFGQPTVTPEGVPTAILAKAVEVEKSVDRVAKWYAVSKKAVLAAVEYEEQLAA